MKPPRREVRSRVHGPSRSALPGPRSFPETPATAALELRVRVVEPPRILQRFVQSPGAPTQGRSRWSEPNQPLLELPQALPIGGGQRCRHQQDGIGSLPIEGGGAEMLAVDAHQGTWRPLEGEAPEQSRQQPGAALVAEDVPGVVEVVGAEGGFRPRAQRHQPVRFAPHLHHAQVELHAVGNLAGMIRLLDLLRRHGLISQSPYGPRPCPCST
jgi:hypothetical protein